MSALRIGSIDKERIEVEDMFPEAFLERMQRMLGEEYGDFLEALGQERYQALRLNPMKLRADGKSAAEVFGTGKIGKGQEELPAAGDVPRRGGNMDARMADGGFAHLSRVPWAEDGYYYEAEDRPGKHPYHDAGLYYIQEPSAMMPVELLGVRQGERILDLCAAPGGKSTQIAAKLGGSGLLICNEIHPLRARALSENIERLGIGNACVTNESPEHLADCFPEYFDRILVDAPCSGEGMFRKNDAACEEWSPENVMLCAERQDGILDCAARMLRPGGRLVYSTCTFAPEEDEGSVCRFLERHGEFTIMPVTSAEKEKLGLAGSDGLAGCSGGCACGEEETPKPTEHDGEAGLGCSVKRNFGLEGTLRLWPQRIRGEGHFAAVLQKTGNLPENSRSRMVNENSRYRIENGTVKGAEWKELGTFADFCQENLRMSLTLPWKSGNANRCLPSEDHQTGKSKQPSDTGERRVNKAPEENLPQVLGSMVGMSGELRILQFGDSLYLVPAQMPSLKGLKVLRPGLQLGELKKNRFEPSHALALAMAPEKAMHMRNLDSRSREITAYLNGETIPTEGEKGWYLICVDGFTIGWGKLAGGVMKNHYPRGLRRKG